MSLAESFAQTGFAKFMNCTTGRVVRIAVGLALIGWGYTLRDGSAGPVLIGIGLVPLVAGLLNLCFISALLGGPISGPAVAGTKPKS
jgi:hypothetical protein